ncbi:hypothetical protein AK830_g8478 [Neonectria ditissima]|uniref:Uncharacterized protein n=1 Tax=Neonectria ditissima TaxID=78410 RepID=A0A0P7BCB3_9HYPO|nr:hypothetical protein AK830_g8478 [Neonectria ditissima]
MSLTVQQLNADSSFLLSFEPIAPNPEQSPFRILLDPWIPGPTLSVGHETSASYDDDRTHISSVRDLPETDLVIISQDRSDHCNKDTLKQLPRTNTRTLILAEPAAAKLIRSWKYFEKDKVLTLEKWEDPRTAGRETATRVAVPPHTPGGDPGEVTVSFIVQKRDRWHLHTAIGITYRPPPSRPLSFYRPLLTPPVSPVSANFKISSRLPSPPPVSNSNFFKRQSREAIISTFPPPPPVPSTPSPPGTPRLTRVRSHHSTRSTRSTRSVISVSEHARDRSISVIFSPHGIPYRGLEPYATTHLVTEAALPLTALLHCFDAVAMPWWRPSSVDSDTPDGQSIAAALGAKAWVSTRVAGRDTHQGWAGKMASRMARTRRYRQSEVRPELDPTALNSQKKAPQTEIMSLAVGEEVALTCEGVWEPPSPGHPRVKSMYG